MLRPLFIALLLAACASVQAALPLPEPVLNALQAAHIRPDALGAIVLRGETVLLSYNAERSMQPASTMKVLTTLVGLEQLGPAFRARTELRSSGVLVDGVLQGDLILRGGADPDFSSAVLEQMLQTLRTQGIREIAGDVIMDRQLFQVLQPGLDSPSFDANPEFHYNVVPDALLLNANMLDVDLRSSGQQLQLQMLPPMDDVVIASDMTLSDAACAHWGDGWRRPGYVREADGKLTVTLHGSFPNDCAQSTSINVLEREDYTERVFRATWRRLGGVLRGTVRSASAPAMLATLDSSRLLAVHISRALPEILRDINKPSDNTLARLLYLSLGSLEADPILGSRPLVFATPALTATRSEQAVRLWLSEHHIDEQGLVLENGSGLSRLERISPQQLAAVLQAGQHSLWAPEFLSSLPIAGLDGTMRRRLRDSPAALQARIKSGSLSNVTAVAGYVRDANQEQCIVVAFINEAQGGGRSALDALIDWVARLEK